MKLPEFIDSQLSLGRGYFTKQAALAELRQSPGAFLASIERLIRSGALVSPRRGFFLIFSPKDRSSGEPVLSEWLDPLMNHLGLVTGSLCCVQQLFTGRLIRRPWSFR